MPNYRKRIYTPSTLPPTYRKQIADEKNWDRMCWTESRKHASSAKHVGVVLKKRRKSTMQVISFLLGFEEGFLVCTHPSYAKVEEDLIAYFIRKTEKNVQRVVIKTETIRTKVKAKPRGHGGEEKKSRIRIREDDEEEEPDFRCIHVNATRDASCDGHEDPVTAEMIADGQGVCLGTRCYSARTVANRNLKNDPFTRRQLAMREKMEAIRIYRATDQDETGYLARFGNWLSSTFLS